jgi:hypothetical protein
MVAGLRALLAGVIDYAGMFPPAKLPLDQAIRNYARYHSGPDAWMLGRFICPAGRLTELLPFLGELFKSGPRVRISALIAAQAGGKEFASQVRSDREAVEKLGTCQGGRAVVDVIEVRLPWDDSGAVQPPTGLPLVAQTREVIRQLWIPSRKLYFEPVLGARWREAAPKWITALADINTWLANQGGEDCRPAGYKLRCGGLEAASFPSAEQVALVITVCRKERVSLKFTAGLHHPVRHFDPDLHTHVHGFLNVFCAGVLAHARGLDAGQVQGIIEEENAGHLVVDEEGLRWKDFTASTEEIVAARNDAVISFGSCSFDEPRDDLRALGLLN